MGKPVDPQLSASQPSSPSSFSSQEFEFSISLSPSSKSSNHLCPADELFYNGQLLPLHLPPRLHMVRTLLNSSKPIGNSAHPIPNTSHPILNSGDTIKTFGGITVSPTIDLLYSTLWSKDSLSETTNSRDSNSSSNDSSCFSTSADTPDCDSSRPSSVTEEERTRNHFSSMKKFKYFSLLPLRKSSPATSATGLNSTGKEQGSGRLRFSSVFRKESSKSSDPASSEADKEITRKKMSKSAKEVFQKYLKKVKPHYEKISQKHDQQQQEEKQQQQQPKLGLAVQEDCRRIGGSFSIKTERSTGQSCSRYSQSFSGNLRYPINGRKKRGLAGAGPSASIGSCPSSMRSSPSHSGIFSGHPVSSMDSTMEELQNAIQGAIAHCKNSIALTNPRC